MKFAAILTVLLVAGSRLPAQGPVNAGLQQRNAVVVSPKPDAQSSTAMARVSGGSHTKQGAVLGSMAGLMAGIVMSTVAGPIGDAADTPAGAVKVVTLSIVAGVALGALIGSMFH